MNRRAAGLRHPVPSYFCSAPEIGTALEQSGMAWIRQNGNACVVVPREAWHDARRLIEEGFRRAGRQVVYVHDRKKLRDLRAVPVLNPDQATAEARPVVAVPGPLATLQSQGGVLMLNLSAVGSAYAESFNDLMEDNHAGEGSRPRVQVVILCTEHDLDVRSMSDAIMSRLASFADMRGFPFPAFPAPPTRSPGAPDVRNASIIDLKYSELWAQRLHGGPMLQGAAWVHEPGALAQASSGGALLLRQAPDDIQLMDDLLMMQNKGKQVYLAAPPTADELKLGAQNKTRATDMHRLSVDAPASVHIVNQFTVIELLEPNLVFNNQGQMASRPPLLEQAAGTQPVLYVAGKLPESAWHRLMQHRTGFSIAAAPSVPIPDIYASNVHACAENPRVHDDLFSVPVGIMPSIDPSLIDKRYLRQDHQKFYVEPTTAISDLIFAARRLASGKWEVEERPLLQALKHGRNAVLIGLEHNRVLIDELASLLEPPHYLTVNGARYHFGQDGGLTGKLLVLTSELADQEWSRTPRYGSPVSARNRDDQVLGCLIEAFPQMRPAMISQHYGRLCAFARILKRQQVDEGASFLGSYQQIEILFRNSIGLAEFGFGYSLRHLFDAAKASTRKRPFSQMVADHPAVVRGVFKDAMIGSFSPAHAQSSSLEPESLSDYLKICLRRLFPEQMEHMPPNSVDCSRLSALLNRAPHEDAIRSHPWKFLNCFDATVLESIIGQFPDLADKHGLEKKVVENIVWLVVNTAAAHGLDCVFSARLDPNSARASQMSGLVLQNYVRPSLTRLPRGERNVRKAHLLLNLNNGLFLKGEPGSGKTHLARQLGQGEQYAVSVAEYGEAEFDRCIDKFMHAQGSATLLIDEVNLLDRHALLRLGEAMLSGGGKRIIVTGNDDHFAGRNLPEFVRDHLPTQRFCTLPDAALIEIFARPITSTLRFLADDGKEWLANQAVALYRGMQAAFPSLAQSPRSMAEFVTQMACVLHMKQGDPDVARYINYVARQAFADAVPEPARQAAQLWLDARFGQTDQALIDAIAPVDLKAMGLAATPGTSRLAQDICWWVKMLDARAALGVAGAPLGHQALLLEGPASIGKDTVAGAVLRQLGRDHIRINAKPWKIEEFKKSLATAIAKGKILIVSELNFLPSAVLEAELNAVLTTPLPGFGLIATINPATYTGRQTLSPALEDRMLRKQLPDYDRSDLVLIAHHIAQGIRDQACRQSRTMQLVPNIASGKIGQAVDLHWELLEKLKSADEPCLPRVRQLRTVLNKLAHAPLTPVEDVFAATYAAYRMRAEHLSPGSRIDSPRDAEMLSVYAGVLRLIQPDCLAYPSLVYRRDLPECFLYDREKNQFQVDVNAKPAAVVAALVAKYSDQPYGIDDAAVHPASDQGPVLAPNIGRTGVGTKDLEGEIGSIHGGQESTYLLFSRLTPTGDLLQRAPACVANRIDHAHGAPSVTLHDARAEMCNGENRLYLPSEAATRPGNVQVDGQWFADHVLRDAYGGWYVCLPPSLNRSCHVEYELIRHDPEAIHVNWETGIIGASWPQDIADLVQRLRTTCNDGGVQDALQVLASFIQHPENGFAYSDEDAEALLGARSQAEAEGIFLRNRKGVCAEFSVAAMRILNAAGIPAVQATGYCARNARIPRQAHDWIEVRLTDESWVTFDPVRYRRRSDVATARGKMSQEDLYSNVVINTVSEGTLKLPLDRLGLAYESAQLGRRIDTVIPGQLDLRRYAQGHPMIFFRNAGLGSEKKIRSLVLTKPAPHWLSSVQDFVPLAVALHCLKSQGVELISAGANSSFKGSIFELYEHWKDQSGHDRGAGQLGSRSDCVIADDRFYERLTNSLYQAAIESQMISAEHIDDSTVTGAIAHTLLFTSMGIFAATPIRVSYMGRELRITRHDMEIAATLIVDDWSTSNALGSLFAYLEVSDEDFSVKNSPILKKIDGLLGITASDPSVSQEKMDGVGMDAVDYITDPKGHYPSELRNWVNERMPLIRPYMSDKSDDG